MLLLLLLIPLISAVGSALFSNAGKHLALSGSIVNFAYAISVWMQWEAAGQPVWEYQVDWIPYLGVSFHLMLDGISMLMILLATLLMPMVIYTSFRRDHKHEHLLYALLLVMYASILGSFLAADGFLFYVFWEIALIPIYLILLYWGHKGSERITLKFFLYTMLGSLSMLIGFIYLVTKGGAPDFEWDSLRTAGQALSVGEQGAIFGAILLAFAVKMPIFPFHTWQPETYYVAPTSGAMMLSGIMLKMATYGIIRWLIPIVPAGAAAYGNIPIALSVIGIIYASFICIVQTDYKKLIAYSSIAHIGLISAGLLSANVQGWQGGLMEMLSHGINSIGLFFVYDIIYTRTGTSDINKLGGIRAIDSKLAFLFFVIILSVVALPFTSGFVGEFLLILGLFQYHAIWAAVAAISIILGVVYMFRAFQKMMLGESASPIKYKPLTRQELIMLFTIAGLILFLGIYPKPILSITENTVQQLLNNLPK